MNKGQEELALKSPPPSKTTLETIDAILEILKSATSLAVVSDFLKSRNLRFSAGSWDEMKQKRIIPAIRKQKITLADLKRLLAEAEEFGRSHIFLYKVPADQVTKFFDENNLRAIAKRAGLENVLDEPKVLVLPANPTLTEIRREDSKGNQSLILKIVESRNEQQLKDVKAEGDQILRTYVITKVRAVNVVRLHASGFLEMRLQSHANSTKYAADIVRIWTVIKEILPNRIFSEFSLGKVRKQLLGRRDELRKVVRFSDSVMRNSNGITISASTGEVQTDLFKDGGAAGDSIDTFLKSGARCDSTNVWWLPDNGESGRQIHCNLGGQDNEFAIPANCTRGEYEYVLNKIRVLSR
jgi:hypothetical protein